MKNYLDIDIAINFITLAMLPGLILLAYSGYKAPKPYLIFLGIVSHTVVIASMFIYSWFYLWSYLAGIL